MIQEQESGSNHQLQKNLYLFRFLQKIIILEPKNRSKQALLLHFSALDNQLNQCDKHNDVQLRQIYIIQEEMGNSQHLLGLCIYGQAKHPIHGDVDAYTIKGQPAKFVMRTKMLLTQQQIQLYEKISERKCEYLIQYYGYKGHQKFNQNSKATNTKIKQQANKNIKKAYKNKNKQQKEYQTYWQYLNYDLHALTADFKLKETPIHEEILWQVIDNMLEACILLRQLNLYPYMRRNFVYFSAGKQPKLYWANLLPNNMHRPYQQYVVGRQFSQSIYAPQQLLQISRNQRRQLDKQKCTVFNLGILILSCICNIDVKSMYNYKTKLLSQVNKRQIITIAKNNSKYSLPFWALLNEMLEYFPKDRCNYARVSTKLDQYYLRNQFSISNIQRKLQQQTNKPQNKEQLSQISTNKKQTNRLKSMISTQSGQKLSKLINC